jgi:hypothetical protein
VLTGGEADSRVIHVGMADGTGRGAGVRGLFLSWAKESTPCTCVTPPQPPPEINPNSESLCEPTNGHWQPVGPWWRFAALQALTTMD